MQKPTLLLLLGTLVLAVGAVLLIPQLTGDEPVPLVTWDAAGEREVAPVPTPESSEALTATGTERTEFMLPSPSPEDAEDRVAVQLRGRVVDRFQRPVADATVWLDFGRGGLGGRGGPGGGLGGRQRRVVEPVRTDRDGRFGFAGQAFRNLRVWLQAVHPQFAPGQFDREIGRVAGASIDVGELVLLAGGEVRGRVTDFGGNGIPGAEVRALPENGNPLQQLRDRERLLPPLLTDQNGMFRWAHLGAGDWSLTVTARRHTQAQSPPFLVEEEQAIDIADIRLGPGFELSGSVRNSRGTGIADAVVVLQEENRQAADDGRGGRGGRGGPGRAGFGGRQHRATTDAQGNFQLDHLPGAPLRVTASANGYLDLQQSDCDPRQQPRLDLVLNDGLRIEGTARDAEGAVVTQFAFRAVRLRGLPPPGTSNVDYEAIAARLRDGSLSDADRQQLREQFGNLREQFGGGRARTGPPGPGGDRNADDGGRGGGARDLGRPEPHPGGTFVAAGLQEGIYELQLQSPEHARYRSPELELRAERGIVRLDVRLDAGHFVAGRVLDSSERPIANARVELRAPGGFAGFGGGRRGRGGADTQDWNGIARDVARQFAGASLNLSTSTDAEGTFVLKHVPKGSYLLAADAPGHARASSEQFELSADRSGFELRLGALGSLAGNVIGLEPDEIASARVAAVPMGSGGNNPGAGGDGGGFGGFGAMLERRGGGGGGPFASAEVSADGSYRMSGLAPGSYIVRAYVGSPQDLMRELMPRFFDGSLTADVEVAGGAEARFDVTISRPQLGEVAGTVMHNGAPGNGLRVELVPASDGETGGRGGRGGGRGLGGRSYQSAIGNNGQFKISKVPVGSYTLQVTNGRAQGVLHSEAVQVQSNATVERTVSVTTHSLTVTVVGDGLEQQSISGALVARPKGSEGIDRSRMFMAQLRGARAEIPNLPAGVYSVRVDTARSGRSAEQEVVVQGPTTVELRLTPMPTPAPASPGQNGR